MLVPNPPIKPLTSVRLTNSSTSASKETQMKLWYHQDSKDDEEEADWKEIEA